MVQLRLSDDENQRLAVLRAIEILDTPPVASFDDIAALASQICETPIALISFVDEDRQWFKCRVGTDLVESPRDASFCAHALLEPDKVMEVRDARADSRFEGNELVEGDLGVCFYAGAPIVVESGHVLGTVCVMDTIPRALTPGQRDALRSLSRQTARLLEQHRTSRALARAAEAIARTDRFIAAQRAVVGVLLESESPEAAGEEILRALVGSLSLDVGAIWFSETETTRLTCTATWSPDADRFAGFLDRKRQTAFNFGEGLPGRIIIRPSPLLISDLGVDPNFPLAPEAIRVGLRACLGFPILGGDAVLGVVEVFSTNPASLDHEMAAAISGLGREIGLAVERARGKAALAESERRIRSVIDASLDAVIVTDHRGLITEFNPAAARTFGWQRHEALGQSIGQLIIPPESLPAHEAGMRRVAAGGAAYILGERLVLTALRRDGTPFACELTIDQLPSEGPPRFTAFLRDVEELTRTQRELREAMESAESASSTMRDFVTLISHELRTPLAVMQGMTELALEEAASPDQEELLTTVRSNAEEALKLVNQILDESMIQSGQMDVVTVPCSLADTAEGAADTFAARAAQKGILLVCDVDPRIPEGVSADPQRLRQILVNLLGNAVKFTAAGSVTLEVSLVERTESYVAVRLTVRDTGPGIPAEHLDRVFERFYRGDSSGGRYGGGSGLGLAISRSLVELMQGRIRVESEEHVGTAFHVELCLALCPGPATCWTRDASPVEGRRILVVGPDDGATRSVKRTLTRLGATAVTVYDPRDAGAIRGEFGAVLLDARLGEEVLRQIEADLAWIAEGVPRVRLGGAAAPGRAALDWPATRRRVVNLLAADGNAPEPRAWLPGRASRHGVRESGGTILLIDDDVDSLRYAERVLQRAGYRVESVRDGAAGLALATDGAFDLVLVDLEMPEMDGIAFTRQLRSMEMDRGLDGVSVVALTAHAPSVALERAEKAGMDGYLTKPVAPDRIPAFLRRLSTVRPRGAGPVGPSVPGPESTPPLARPSGGADPAGAGIIEIDPMIADLVPDFLVERARDVEDTRAMLAQGDINSIARLGHNMKGSGLSYGFIRITEVGRRIEEAAKRSDFAGIELATAELERFLSEVGWRVGPEDESLRSAARSARRN